MKAIICNLGSRLACCCVLVHVQNCLDGMDCAVSVCGWNIGAACRPRVIPFPMSTTYILPKGHVPNLTDESIVDVLLSMRGIVVQRRGRKTKEAQEDHMGDLLLIVLSCGATDSPSKQSRSIQTGIVISSWFLKFVRSNLTSFAPLVSGRRQGITVRPNAIFGIERATLHLLYHRLWWTPPGRRQHYLSRMDTGSQPAGRPQNLVGSREHLFWIVLSRSEELTVRESTPTGTPVKSSVPVVVGSVR